MTTPDTSAVRAWARDNGIEIGDRGRIPAEVQEAYRAAHGGSAAKPTSGRAKATKPRPAKAAAKTAKPAAKASATSSDGAAAGERTPRPKPSPVADDRRLVALGEELAALTKRVEALEASVGAKGNGKSGGKPGEKKPLFRRHR